MLIKSKNTKATKLKRLNKIVCTVVYTIIFDEDKFFVAKAGEITEADDAFFISSGFYGHGCNDFLGTAGLLLIKNKNSQQEQKQEIKLWISSKAVE